jgi:hypothetical protein
MKKLGFLFLVLIFSFGCKGRGGALGSSSSSDPATPLVLEPGLECPVCEECAEEVVCEECEEQEVDEYCRIIGSESPRDGFGLFFGFLASSLPDEVSEDIWAISNSQISGTLLIALKRARLRVSKRGEDFIKNMSAYVNSELVCYKIFEPFRCKDVEERIENNIIFNVMTQIFEKYSVDKDMKKKIEEALGICLTDKTISFNEAFSFLFEEDFNDDGSRKTIINMREPEKDLEKKNLSRSSIKY